MSEAKLKEYVVFLFRWDLLPLSKLIEKAAPVSGLPPKYFHIGIGVYNTLYHYTQRGISTEFSMYRLLPGPDGKNYFFTTKTREELNLFLQGIREEFRAGTYNVSQNCCLTFAHKVCDFLGILFVGDAANLENWLKDKKIIENGRILLESHPTLQLLAGVSSSFSRSSSSSDVKSHVDVKEEVQNLVKSVQSIMQTAFALTGSGARYAIEDGSVENLA